MIYFALESHSESQVAASSALSTPIASVTFVTHTTCAFLLSYCCTSCYRLSACASKV